MMNTVHGQTTPQPSAFYELFRNIERRPGMYLNYESLVSLELYFEGYDMACTIHGLPSLLLGIHFTRWLKRSEVCRIGGENISWSSLILMNSENDHDACARFFVWFRAYHSLTSGHDFGES